MPQLIDEILSNLENKSLEIDFCEKERSICGFDLLERMVQKSKDLGMSGFRPGDLFLLSVEDKLDFLSLFLAALKLRLVPILVDPKTARRDIVELQNEYQIRLISDNFIPTANESFEGDSSRRGLLCDTDFSILKEGAFGLLTSGTTGESKIIILKQSAFYYALKNSPSSMVPFSDDIERRYLLYLSPYHLAGLYSLFSGLLTKNVRIYFSKHSGHLYKLFKEIEKRKITDILLLASILKVILKFPTLKPLDQQMVVWLGGDHLTEKDLNLAKDLFPMAAIFNCYAMTEVLRIACNNLLDNKSKIMSVGKTPVPSELKIEPLNGESLANVTMGEICVKSPSAYWGYLESGKLVRHSPNEYFKTGDIGYIDEEGFLYILGRKKTLLKCNSKSIFPEKIERKLKDFLGVVEVVVSARRDEVSGDIPICVLRTDADFDFLEFKKYAKCSLSEEECPRFYILVENIPKTRTGKVDRAQVKELVVQSNDLII